MTSSCGDSFVSDLFLATDANKRYEKAKTAILQMFIYLDSAVCHKCILQNKELWSDFRDIEQSADKRFSVNYVITPKQHGNKVLIDYIRQLGLHNTVYFDSGHDFLNMIQKLPDYEAGKPRIILLDDKNNILLSDTPEKSSTTYNKYRHIIKLYMNTL